jgi:hypothetical protein
MTSMTHIVERLRLHAASFIDEERPIIGIVMYEAADEIERLRDRIKQLEAAHQWTATERDL